MTVPKREKRVTQFVIFLNRARSSVGQEEKLGVSTKRYGRPPIEAG